MSSKRPRFQRQHLIITIAVLCVLLAVGLTAAWIVSSAPSGTPDTRPPTASPTTLPSDTTQPAAVETQPTTQATTPPTLPPETQPADETTVPVTTAPPVTQPTAPSDTTAPPVTQPTAPPETSPPPTTQPLVETIPVTYDRFSLFSGQYVEDGRDELVENVAAILVTNVSEKFLDLATLTFELDGKTANFVVTGLPAGQSAWVMEQNRMTATHSSTLTYLDCVSSVREDAVSSTQQITITADGNVLTARNNTNETLKDVCVYYKVKHDDGNFFGGITYLVSFGDLEPGASAQSIAGHYNETNTQIVRIGWYQ